MKEKEEHNSTMVYLLHTHSEYATYSHIGNYHKVIGILHLNPNNYQENSDVNRVFVQKEQRFIPP